VPCCLEFPVSYIRHNFKRAGKGGRQPKSACFVACRIFSGSQDRHPDLFVAGFLPLLKFYSTARMLAHISDGEICRFDCVGRI
jgi:hypothetical protein